MQKKRLVKLSEEMEIEETPTLSSEFKGDEIQIINGNFARGGQGYATVMSSKSVSEGSFYFEVEIMSLKPESNIRIGISPSLIQKDNENIFETPVGYYEDGYSFSCRDGKIFNKRKGINWASPVKEGDTICVIVTLGPVEPPMPFILPQKYSHNSCIGFFINDHYQGIAFTKLNQCSYHAAISLFNKAEAKLNIGPICKFQYEKLLPEMKYNDQFVDLRNAKPMFYISEPEWDNSYFK